MLDPWSVRPGATCGPVVAAVSINLTFTHVAAPPEFRDRLCPQFNEKRRILFLFF